jgi:RNA polymerase sigma factor (sigma-70 family)
LENSPVRNKDWTLTQESFDQLLGWLDPDREISGRKYEGIRTRLIKLFACRGCAESEDLADECINRVAKKLPQIVNTYEGDPALYFYGVARHIHQEYLRRPAPAPEPIPQTDEESEHEYECLNKCLEELPPDSRNLVLQYYHEEKKAKIDHRKEMALRLGIAVNALRIRAYRIRATLQGCVHACLERKQFERI